MENMSAWLLSLSLKTMEQEMNNWVWEWAVRWLDLLNEYTFIEQVSVLSLTQSDWLHLKSPTPLLVCENSMWQKKSAYVRIHSAHKIGKKYPDDLQLPSESLRPREMICEQNWCC